MKELMLRLVREEEGQDLIEYGLLVVFIALVCVAALELLGPVVADVYTDIQTELETRPGA